jgi:DNA-binding CsgD family transcriptional regulator/PAS domain-containing protein
VLFKSDEDRLSGERLLEKHTRAAVLRLGPTMREAVDLEHVLRVRDAGELRTWLRSPRRGPAPTQFLLALNAEFEAYQKALAALASMRVRPPHLLTSGQDQIWVLDRQHRMVAFFGSWPKESPRRPQDLIGKRKRDIFGPEIATVHEAAVLRALEGDEAAYEWSLTDVPHPVHLFTAASPLRNDDGAIAGVLLVTRNVTALKEAQLALERALKEKTSQLLELEVGVKRIAEAFRRPQQREPEPRPTAGLHTRAFLSRREHEILDLLRGGARLRSIAHTLGISIETVRRHVKTMFRKTGVHSQDALVKLFSGRGDAP